MDINYLKAICLVIEEGNISIAAKKMHISQSALSQQIGQIEHSLGTKLFERSNRGVLPTATGKIVYNHANEIINTYNIMLQEVADINNDIITITILATPIIYSYALPCVLYQMKQLFPNYQLEIQTASSEEIEQKLLAGYGDFGVILDAPSRAQLSGTKIFSDELHLVIATNSDISIPKKLTPKTIKNYPILTLGPSQRTQRLIERHLFEHNISVNELKVLYPLDSTHSIKLSVKNGFAIAFLPYIAIKGELYKKELRSIDFGDKKLIADYYLICNKKKTYSSKEHATAIQNVKEKLHQFFC